MGLRCGSHRRGRGISVSCWTYQFFRVLHRDDIKVDEELLVFESNVRSGDTIHMTVSKSIGMESKDVVPSHRECETNDASAVDGLTIKSSPSSLLSCLSCSKG